MKKIKCFFRDIGRKTFLSAIQKIILKKVKRRKSPNTLVVISTHAMGDLLYCLAFLKGIKQKNPAQKIVVVSLAKFKYILDTFDSYDEAVVIRSNQRLALFQSRCLAANLGNGKQMLQAGIFGEYQNVFFLFPRFMEENMDYIAAMRRMYDLDENTSPEFHRVLPAPVTCIPNFTEICERCVVLNPYSNSAEWGDVGRVFFERVCRRLQENGYIVYTNVIKDQQPVPGSLPLRCSLEELLGIAGKVPFMISLRSGVCDFLMPSGVNLFVMYNKMWYYTWYRLKSWGGQGELEEIYYDKSAGEAGVRRLEEAFDAYLKKIGHRLPVPANPT